MDLSDDHLDPAGSGPPSTRLPDPHHARMTGVTGGEEGLRERKRAAMEANIRQTAMDLVLEHGYEHVTVDMICTAAMVSARTFFNYFGSKEGVILGPTPPIPAMEEIEKFCHRGGSNVVADFVALVTAAVAEHEPDPQLVKSRRAIIQRTPELLTRELARMAEVEDQFVQIVLMRFHTQGRDSGPDAGLEDEARMIVALSIGVLRYAMQKWFNDSFSGSTRDLIAESIELLQRITSDMSPRP